MLRPTATRPTSPRPRTLSPASVASFVAIRCCEIDSSFQGVLVHFGEQQTPQPGTKVPWIAFVTCDTNGTSFSDTDDIFSLARDRGAVAALLYSFTSEVRSHSLNPQRSVLTEVTERRAVKSIKTTCKTFRNRSTFTLPHRSKAPD